MAAAVLFVAAAVAYVASGGEPAGNGDSGAIFPSCNLWMPAGVTQMLLNVACVVAAGYLLKYLNRLHGFIRGGNAAIMLSAFLMLQLATPALAGCFFEGTLMLVVVLLSAYMLFSTYHQRYSARSVFLIFALIGFYAMFQFMALYLAVVLIVGTMQMRVLGLRGFIAMLLGLLTPYWICYGFGIISFADFDMPDVRTALNVEEISWRLAATCALSALATLLLLLSNMVHIISYNAKRRACNGFFTVLTMATIIMMAIDSDNVMAYMPTFNVCLAVQVGHAFTISKNDKRYIPVLVLCGLCVGMCIYNLCY